MNRRGFLARFFSALVAPVVVPTLKVAKVFGYVPKSTLAEELIEATRRAYIPKMYAQLWRQTPLMAALLAQEEHRNKEPGREE